MMVPACFLNVMILIYSSALKISLHLKEDEDNLLPKKVQHIYLAVCNKQTVSSSFASVNTRRVLNRKSLSAGMTEKQAGNQF